MDAEFRALVEAAHAHTLERGKKRDAERVEAQAPKKKRADDPIFAYVHWEGWEGLV